jgi:hypothetical protein
MNLTINVSGSTLDHGVNGHGDHGGDSGGGTDA